MNAEAKWTSALMGPLVPMEAAFLLAIMDDYQTELLPAMWAAGQIRFDCSLKWYVSNHTLHLLRFCAGGRFMGRGVS